VLNKGTTGTIVVIIVIWYDVSLISVTTNLYKHNVSHVIEYLVVAFVKYTHSNT